MAKAASSRFRDLGASRIASGWEARAEICERCPLRVISRGVSYCGTPFLRKIDRDPVLDGCGCPTRDKARTPGEHCPVDPRHQAVETAGGCNCKWCAGKNPNDVI
jgi:hypothetical protein